METIYRQGDLIRFVRFEGKWTLCGNPDVAPKVLREFPIKDFEIYTAQGLAQNFIDFEGKLGLVVKVHRNRLEQPLGYQVLIGEVDWFCKSVTADKYFSLAENPGDESR
tara:strand:+ start:2909 stop:3235 length:327 start_codon:yes stop_codon:yes gene_type:complete